MELKSSFCIISLRDVFDVVEILVREAFAQHFAVAHHDEDGGRKKHLGHSIACGAVLDVGGDYLVSTSVSFRT